jgi:hypothetical protein
MPNLPNTKSAFEYATTQESSGTGKVLDVRLWRGSNLIEIDLHLPGVDMLNWIEVMQITFSISKLCSWKTVPFGWDVETATCSIIIDTVRDTTCATWANLLRRLDEVVYTNICACSEKLHSSNLVIGIADSSNLGFILALEQLVKPSYKFEAFMLLQKNRTAKLLHEYFDTQTIVVTNPKYLVSRVVSPQYCANHTSFYLGGDSCFTNNIFIALKAMNYHNIHVLPFGAYPLQFFNK